MLRTSSISFEFNVALARHIGDEASNLSCACVSIPSQPIRNTFWAALASVVHNSFEEVSVIDTDYRLTRLKAL